MQNARVHALSAHAPCTHNKCNWKLILKRNRILLRNFRKNFFPGRGTAGQGILRKRTSWFAARTQTHWSQSTGGTKWHREEAGTAGCSRRRGRAPRSQRVLPEVGGPSAPLSHSLHEPQWCGLVPKPSLEPCFPSSGEVTSQEPAHIQLSRVSKVAPAFWLGLPEPQLPLHPPPISPVVSGQITYLPWLGSQDRSPTVPLPAVGRPPAQLASPHQGLPAPKAEFRGQDPRV